MIDQVIENKVKELKEKLKDIRTKNDKYFFEVYNILREIFDLRSNQIENYTLSDLAREKGIDFKVRLIRGIFEFEFMTKKTEQLIKSGKLTHNAYKTLISINTDFRKPILQNRIVGKYLNKEISLNDMTHFSGFKLRSVIEEGGKITKRDKDKISIEFHLKQIAMRLRKDKTLLNEIKKEYEGDRNIFQVIRFVKKNYLGECPKCFTKIYRKDIE